jgi:4-amino-4-deoxy-L-arabinose transferase-like glycosyltransferase
LALFSSLACVLVAWLGGTLLSARVAWLTGLASAGYPTLVFAPTRIQAVAPATFFVVALAVTAVTIGNRKAPWLSLLGGFVAGVAALVDPILLVLVPALPLYFWIRTRTNLKELARHSILLALGTSLVVAPWVVRNFLVHHRFFPVKSTFWYAFWLGNNRNSEGTDKLLAQQQRNLGPLPPVWRIAEHHRWLRAARDAAVDVNSKISPELLQKLSAHSEAGKMDIFRDEILRDLARSPGHYAKLVARRLRFFLLFDETNPMTFTPLYRWSHVLLLISFVGGAIRTRGSWRALSIIYLFLLLAAVFHALTLVAPRFQIPFQPLMLLVSSGLFRGNEGVACEAGRQSDHNAGQTHRRVCH